MKKKRRKHLVGGNNAQHYQKLKAFAQKILNETPGYDESYIVGSMAIALHEEAQGKQVSEPYPNDIDIVIPVEGTPGKVPDIYGMSSQNQTATKGATFVHEEDPTLSIDVIQEPIRRKKRSNNFVDINGLRVLNIESLKSRYQEIVDAWESEPEEKEIARNKVERLNYLSDDTETIDPRAAEHDIASVSRSLF
tara:strand:+ start:295 stop:873 length:579 start_codon:yes stop_codon:yes gene_type:complete